MNPDDLRNLLSAPLIASAISATVPFLSPPWRWTRRLRAYGEIMSTLPEGPVRQAFWDDFMFTAERLAIYRRRDLLPKVLTWVLFVGTGSGLVILALFGLPYLQGAEWVVPVMLLLSFIPATYSLIHGGNMFELEKSVTDEEQVAPEDSADPVPRSGKRRKRGK